MREFSFNLVDQLWIPCIDRTGAAVDLNLRQVLTQAHQLQSVAGDSPLVTVALHRLLMAVLHRVFGPKNEDVWADLWEARAFDTTQINDYLDRWQSQFDLFDEKQPFYQAPDKRMRAKSTINLSHDRASGNNPTLFDHHTEDQGEILSAALAARLLITAQTYGLAGLSGITQKFTDGTCAGGIIFLVEGDTLMQTLLLNMLQYPSNIHFQPQTDKDVPAWEMADPYTPDRALPFGYLDYLTWQNRRILLQPEWLDGNLVVRSMTMGPALRMDPSVLDPMKNYRKDDKLGYLALSFIENRVMWRDSASLFALSPEMDGKMRPPATFHWLRWLLGEVDVPERHTRYRTLALGMSKKQAKVFFFRQEKLPMPLDYLINDSLVIVLNVALQQTGTIAFDLLQSARLMGMYKQLPVVEEREWQKQWQGLNPNAKAAISDWINHSGMERNYWASLDIPFQSFIVDLARDEEKALNVWHEQLRKSAWNAFEQAAEYVGNDRRSFKAIVRGHSYLNYRLDELLSTE